jgi:LPXTG-site transpeptidase (sortase) family protein
MTAVAAAPRWRRRPRPATADVPALSPRLQLARAALLGVLIISLCLLVEMLVLSGLQQRAAQQRAYNALRADLATGTAAIGPTDADGDVLALGTPVAYLEVPAIGLRQVIVEGTTPSNLFNGPGHRRDTPLPGQVGTSMVLGRRAAFGGPFARIGDLRAGDLIHVTTGQGEFAYRVTGVREEGEPAPEPIGANEGRLLLATAAGRPFMPSGVLRVDAELDGDAVGGATRLMGPSALPAREQLMGADVSTLWALALWLQALAVLAVAAVWAWHRWGRTKAWVVFLPALVLVGLNVASEAARMLPNLL